MLRTATISRRQDYDVEGIGTEAENSAVYHLYPGDCPFRAHTSTGAFTTVRQVAILPL